jgi:DNA-binding NarL/FixJ family response regulator
MSSRSSALLGRGHPRKEIATELTLSDNAVRLHVQSILVKLGLATGGPPPPDSPPSPLCR